LERRALENMRDVSLGKNLPAQQKATENAAPIVKMDEKEYQQKQKQLKKEVQDAERRIQRLEADIVQFEQKMGDMKIFGNFSKEDCFIACI